LLALTKPGKFCIFPWFGTKIGDVRYQPCCQFNHRATEYIGQNDFLVAKSSVAEFRSSPYLQYVREQLDAGIEIPECNQCWQDEANGTKSYRQTSSTIIFSNPKLSEFAKKDMPLLSAEVKIGNTCNYACAMCNPKDSTKIYSEWVNQQDNEFVLDYTTSLQHTADNESYFDHSKNLFMNPALDRLGEVLSSNILHLKLLGGEPLLYAQVIQKLIDLPDSKKSKIALGIITNGSKPIAPVVEKLGAFKKITVEVSLEGVGKIQEYIRKGSIWNEVERNILEYHNLKDNRFTLDILNLVQAMSVEHQYKLVEWCKLHDITLTQDLLYAPSYLNINSLTDDLINSLAYCPSFSSHKHVPEQRAKLVRFIEWYESRHTMSLKEISPEVYNDIS